jgi:hypothetical protein
MLDAEDCERIRQRIKRGVATYEDVAAAIDRYHEDRCYQEVREELENHRQSAGGDEEL